MWKLAVSALALSAIAAGVAFAHTPYMKPAAFYTTDAQVTVDAAYATQFFTPAVGLSSPNFQVIGPSGHAYAFTNSAILPQDSTLQADMPDGGTYRVTSGERLGDITQMVAENGTWRALAQGETPPADAQTSSLQPVSVAEAYVTRGTPTRGAVDINIGRLAIHPITHPNQVLVSTGFEVQLLLDGQPFPNMPFVLYEAGDPESKLDRTFVTGADGHTTLTFDHPGTYVAVVRYRGAAPADAGVAVRSYTTSLTFNVLAQLPPVTRITPPQHRRSFYDQQRGF